MKKLFKKEPTKEELYNFYIIQKMSIPEISILLNIGKSSIRRRLIKFDIDLRNIKGALSLVKHKLGHFGKREPFSQEARRRMSAARFKWADSNAKGTSFKPSGYIAITRGINRDKHEHIIIMELFLSRKLNPDEVVHHINGIKNDNRIENLLLMTRSEHSSFHGKINYLKRKRDSLGKFL